MAQPQDIEDVLSSIRRLVATDAAKEAIAPTDDATTGTSETALVLDPKQRVTEPEDPFQMIRALAQEERDGRDAGSFTDAVPDEISAISTDLEAEPMANWDDAELASDVAEAAASPVPEDYAEDTDYQGEAEAMGPEIAPIEEVMQPEMAGASKVREAEKTAAEEDATDLSDVVDAIPGDDALRDLIAEIVRQELAGELGERITRNVRKLVRRELRQLLNSDEFD
ncbi:hypothetical protein [uncultured Jannaschia sp.]|uniref:hypothetical protein n=1 Tax=uncultured Jannaschia sp. TaxID=293347 RepID=UPI0026081EEC|nr:hypothetical protein [uncultured Jannaschia sp.]